MGRIDTIAAGLMATLGLAGCVEHLAQGPERNTSAATWQMPWQISPITGASEQREETVPAFVPESGFVRATPQTMASIGKPLEPRPGPNFTVETCRDTVLSEAKKVGARDVEAVSAGAHHRDAKGNYVAPVLIRITYASLITYSVREATLTCIVDRDRKIVDAFV